MNYYNIHNVDNINKLKCSQKSITNFTGILSCSQYFGPDNTINYGVDYLKGEYYQKTEDVLPLNYEFNNLNFTNIIQDNLNSVNINQCHNPDNCINKEIYAKKKLKSNDLSSDNGNFSKLCNTQQLCENENKNYITNKKYLLKKICNDDECSYSLNCGCNKK